MSEAGEIKRTLGIGTSAPAVSPRSSIMLTMSIERSATWRSKAGGLAVFHLDHGRLWARLTDDDGDAIVGDEGDGVWALISHSDGVQL